LGISPIFVGKQIHIASRILIPLEVEIKTEQGRIAKKLNEVV